MGGFLVCESHGINMWFFFVLFLVHFLILFALGVLYLVLLHLLETGFDSKINFARDRN